MAVRWRQVGLTLLTLAALSVGGVAWANWRVSDAAQGRVYLDAKKVPARPVGLVLGTSPGFHGVPNAFFERRLDAAAALYRAGKVRCLLVSGDHGSRYYNEVEAMQKGLVKRGVPAEKIALDHAGFRTLDSLVRAKKVFDIDQAVIVTDGFHLPRALYLAGQNGIDAVGLSSVPLTAPAARRPAIREIGARALMMIDVLTHRQPRYLGPHEPLPAKASRRNPTPGGSSPLAGTSGSHRAENGCRSKIRDRQPPRPKHHWRGTTAGRVEGPSSRLRDLVSR